LVEYFRNSATKVNSILSDSTPLDLQPENKRTLYDALPEKFATGQGLSIAEGLGIPERTFKRFLNDKELFNNVSWGNYEKRIKQMA
jgi:hypothetical protein